MELSQRADNYANAIFEKKGPVDTETGKAAVDLPPGAATAFSSIKYALLGHPEIANAAQLGSNERSKFTTLALTATEVECKTA